MTARPDLTIADLARRLRTLAHTHSLGADEELASRIDHTELGFGRSAGATNTTGTPDEERRRTELETHVREGWLAGVARTLEQAGCSDPGVVFIAADMPWRAALEVCELINAPTALAPDPDLEMNGARSTS